MLVYGKNVCREILDKNLKIKKAYISGNFNDKNIENQISVRCNDVKILPNKKLDEITSSLHQGIILDIEDYKYSTIEDIINEKSDAFIVMLDHIEDPHNLGAIIRTCESAGVDGIIIPKDRSVDINSTVIKTSVGTIWNVKIAKVTNLVNTINILKDNGYWIVGTNLDGTDYRTIDYNMKKCLIIGNEGKGISKLVSKNCDILATIPMKGSVNSLNASVAAGVMIYQMIK